jgi:glutaredoxin-like YruB-family protein
MENEVKSQKNIRVFTTPTCIYCHNLKKFFAEHNLKFEEIDVSENREALEEMVQKSGQMGVPVVEIDGEIVVGFNKEKICQLLKLRD